MYLTARMKFYPPSPLLREYQAVNPKDCAETVDYWRDAAEAQRLKKIMVFRNDQG